MLIAYPVARTYRIYTDTPHIAIRTSARRVITATNDLFTACLGADGDPNLDAPVLLYAAFTGVMVGHDPEMTPRQVLNSV